MTTTGRARTRWTTLVPMMVAAGFFLALTQASAQQTREGATVSGSDRKFVTEAAQGGMAEVQLGKLAEERASSDAVKQFGQRMVTDHGKANHELSQLAQDKGITPPAEPDTTHQRLHDRLAKLSGAEFDRAYVDAMVKDHRKDVADFKREADRAKDPAVKAWAQKTLPTLEEHLKMAEDLSAQVKRTSSTR